MRRIATSLLALAGAAVLGGCDLGPDFSDACIIGPCYSSGGGGDGDFIIGFPSGRVDRSNTTPDGGYLGRVAVGDTFTLHLVHGPGPARPESDTVWVRRWTVTDGAVADIAGRPGGGGLFTARAPGRVQVSADGLAAQLWACQGQGCARVSEIVVTR